MAVPPLQDPPPSLRQQIVEDLRPHIRTTVVGLFTIFRVTILLLATIWAADLILASVSSSLEEVVRTVPYMADVLLGLKIFAAIGLAITFVIYVAVSLYLDVREQVHRLPPRRRKGSDSDASEEPPDEPPTTGGTKPIEDTSPPVQQGCNREASARERVKP